MLVGATSYIDSPTKNPSEPKQSLGQDDFLRLLVLQLQHQDPLDPIKNEQFVAQMAQFSSLEQLINIGESISEQSLIQSSINNSQAVNLIGKEITVSGSALRMSGGAPSQASFYLGAEADAVSVKIRDSAGATVRSIELGRQLAGRHELEFDGKDDGGAELPDGEYSFVISALDADGNPVQSYSYTQVFVEGLTFSEGIVYLVSGGYKYMLSDVVEVRLPTP